MSDAMSKYQGSDSGPAIRAELERLRSEAAGAMVQELEAHDERLVEVEEWRTHSRIEEAGRNARSEERDRRISILEAALKEYLADKLSTEKFKERVQVWGTVAMLLWPIIVVAVGKLLK